MDRAASLIFPGTKTLAGWWRRFVPFNPRAVWVGYAYLHRIEAPVETVHMLAVDPLVHLILQAVELTPSQEIAGQLALPRPILLALLQDLRTDGLVESPSADVLSLTPRGREALEKRQLPVRRTERRLFPFLERFDAGGQRLGDPEYVPINECVNVPWTVDDPLRFDVATLAACAAQSSDWKRARSFSEDVDRIVSVGEKSDWRQVVVDRPERALLALLVGVDEVVGFAIKADGWVLYDQTPALRMPVAGCPTLSSQACELAAWRDAWRAWGKQRNLPGNEVEACVVTYPGPRIEVQAPARMIQRLQAANSDALKGEAWLMVGDGFWRCAAPLVLKASV